MDCHTVLTNLQYRVRYLEDLHHIKGLQINTPPPISRHIAEVICDQLALDKVRNLKAIDAIIEKELHYHNAEE